MLEFDASELVQNSMGKIELNLKISGQQIDRQSLTVTEEAGRWHRHV